MTAIKSHHWNAMFILWIPVSYSLRTPRLLLTRRKDYVPERTACDLPTYGLVHVCSLKNCIQKYTQMDGLGTQAYDRRAYINSAPESRASRIWFRNEPVVRCRFDNGQTQNNNPRPTEQCDPLVLDRSNPSLIASVLNAAPKRRQWRLGASLERSTCPRRTRNAGDTRINEYGAACGRHSRIQVRIECSE
jgi:hypothetical protein